MSTRAQVQAQINRINGEISSLNQQITTMRNTLADVEKARRELIEIQSWVAEDNRALNQLDCENPQMWKGYNQSKCESDYSECVSLGEDYAREFENLAEELNETESRILLNIQSHQSTIAGLNSSVSQLQNMLSQIPS